MYTQKAALALAAVLMLSIVSTKAQDTTVVQTFTFDDITKRRGTYVFPPSSTSWRKILMYKTLKCDNATTQDQYPCGEWDYLTYTFVYDHTGVLDSNAGTHPFYLFGGYDVPSASTHNTPMFDVHQWVQETRVIDSVIADTVYTLANGSASSSVALASDEPSSRFQFILKSGDLVNSGLTADTIDRVQLNVSQLGSDLKHLTIRMRNYAFGGISNFENVGMTTVFERNVQFSGTGIQTLNLTTPFAWNGSSHILVELSFTNDAPGTAHTLVGETQSDSNAIYAHAEDGYAVFGPDRNRIEIPLSSYDFGDEITISFWMNGDADIQPINNSILEAWDFNDIRALNVHMPWGNGSVYWDAGSGSGYDRINKSANASNYEGGWNHWAFTKNATTGEMKIYLNGSQWQSGTDKNRTLGVLKKLIIGSAVNNNPFYGKVDEFRVWKKELSSTEIAAWMYKDVNSSHPDYNDLAIYLQFNDEYNLVNAAPSTLEAFWHGAPTVVQYPGTELFRNHSKTDVFPSIGLVQGNYVDTIILDTLSDTVAQAPFTVVEYDATGNTVEAINATYTNPEGWSYTYGPDGEGIDSSFYSGTQQWSNDTLDFFYPPYEVVDRYEIGRFITPYGIGLSLGPDGFTWVYDVTDYAHLLVDSVDISSGNQQELLDLKFVMVEGTPPANVVEFTRPWGQSRSVRYWQMDDDAVLEPTTIDVHANAARQKVITRLTGHGHNSDDGSYPHCCEWKDNTHYLYVNGSMATQWHIWQTNACAFNPVFPQGGTWPGAREGWCPGDVVHDYEYDISSLVSGSSYQLDYQITPVPNNNQGMGNGSYVVAMHVIQYDEPANALDAEVYDIIKPNNRGYYSRMNPVCHPPVVVIRNNGSTNLTSLKIHYGVSGGITKTYEWTGSLGFLEKEEVELPYQDGAFYLGDGSNRFIASVSAPNGGVDGYADNDELAVSFELPPVYEEEVIVQYKTNNFPGENNLRVYNSLNQLVLNRSGSSLSANTTYWDTLALDTGCYTLEITDSENDGLSYWAWPGQGAGYLRLWNDGGVVESFEPEFGHKIEYAFAIDAMTIDTVTVEVNGQTAYVIGGDTFTMINGELYPLGIAQQSVPVEMNVYPNPNRGSFYIELHNYIGEAQLSIRNISGQLVHSSILPVKGSFARKYDLRLSSGVYLIEVMGDGMLETRKMVIER